MPLVTPEKAAQQWALFESLKAKLLSSEDYQTIAGKRYIKRSGFRRSQYTLAYPIGSSRKNELTGTMEVSAGASTLKQSHLTDAVA